MFTSRLNPFALTALVVLLLTGVTATTARSATPEEIKKQQDQIRERSKETEDKAQSDKQAREREEARKAQELRDKQWKEENPNSPLPRPALPDPANRPPVSSGGMMAPPPLIGDPNARSVQAALAQIDFELRNINQRLQRLEQMLNAQGQTRPPPALTGGGSNPNPRPPTLTDTIADQQAQIRERSRANDNRAQAEANEKEWAERRRAQDQRNGADNRDSFITPAVVSDYYLGPKEPPLRR